MNNVLIPLPKKLSAETDKHKTCYYIQILMQLMILMYSTASVIFKILEAALSKKN